MKIFFLGGLPRSLINFRGPVIKSMIARGMTVCAAANGPDEEISSTLKSWGAAYYPIKISRAGMNPFRDVVTLFQLIRLIREVKPDIVLGYTIKPVIFGGLAARFCRVKYVYAMIEGLGRPFMPWESLSHALSSIIAKCLYRIGLCASCRVFFLNPDDLNHFVDGRYLPGKKTVLLNGIGIDLEYYAQSEISGSVSTRFLMIARLLKDKGVREYVAAAKIIRERFKDVEFVLAGDLDDNPSSVSQKELDEWQNAGVVHYVGFVKDVRPLINDCHVYVLPSYREGTPRTVLEAMATGRPIITTDAPGCRETVRDGENGFLVPVKDVDALVEAMETFIKQPELIAIMGKRSRQIAEEKYDVHKVNEVILRNMGLCRANPPSHS